MIKSKSWEISAWNPKDSAMVSISFKLRGDGGERGGWEQTHERVTLFIYLRTAHRDSSSSFRPRSNGKLDAFPEQYYST